MYNHMYIYSYTCILIFKHVHTNMYKYYQNNTVHSWNSKIYIEKFTFYIDLATIKWHYNVNIVFKMFSKQFSPSINVFLSCSLFCGVFLV